MTNIPNTTPEQEIEELRSEVRRLREGQDQLRRQSEKQEQEAPDKDLKNDGKREDKDNGGKDGKQESDEAPEKPHTVRNIVIGVVVLIVLVAGLIWWLDARKYETTDDAFVEAHTSGISVRIAGVITGVYFEENQTVKAGDILATLDARDYEVALRTARSQVQQAVAQTQAEQPSVSVTQATNVTNISTANSSVAAATAAVESAQRNYEAALFKVREAEANNIKAQADVARYRPLAEKDEVPREQFDRVVAEARALEATLLSARASAEAAKKQVDQAQESVNQARSRAAEAQENAPRQEAIRRANVAVRQAGAETASAQLQQNLLNLSYTKIQTPVSGIIIRRTAEVGQHLTPGQQIFQVAQIDDLWVTANFKETQTRRLRNQQSVRIHVDATDQDFDGYVESLPSASGAVTSLLPPENATGNYVKVVQRLPVRIRFKKDQPGIERLRPGMSVEPKTRVE